MMIHSRCYRFLFTLTIPFIAIFDYEFNIQNFTYISQSVRPSNNEEILNHSMPSSKSKKAFQIHAQAALEISSIDQTAGLCLVSA